MSKLDKVYGIKEGSCAWCSTQAITSYEGVMSNGERVAYQVCIKHYDEFAGYSDTSVSTNNELL